MTCWRNGVHRPGAGPPLSATITGRLVIAPIAELTTRRTGQCRATYIKFAEIRISAASADCCSRRGVFPCAEMKAYTSVSDRRVGVGGLARRRVDSRQKLDPPLLRNSVKSSADRSAPAELWVRTFAASRLSDYWILSRPLVGFWTHFKSPHFHSFFLQLHRHRRKIKAITTFEVIEVGTNRKPVCNFLLVINSNWHPISYRFRVFAAYCSNFVKWSADRSAPAELWMRIFAASRRSDYWILMLQLHRP